ncbi:hypothetical protein M438DRAFT_353630 [Aureobasidium pullulans EXF-150]|uniref:BTB domain-containing protein n=1 Tax=Aureobasidium pullulans EXF-150 TaxID=1043002 RepID=A0A074XX32_AURPU|nr:uncharacterized protein M438DRAFT_353630 [Aureobasidium pullulans EXF-150]KEQ86507.1 hypothetical protein M438DRAFT_353630 [Aureobasidium pullulans EXF-150]
MDDSQTNQHLSTNSQLPDVVLTFGDERVDAHKDILRSKSEVFVAAFSGKFGEVNEYAIEGHSDAAIHAMIQHIYGFAAIVAKCELFLGVYLLANEYDIVGLTVDVTEAIIYCMEYLLCVQRFEEPSPRALDSVISSVISLFEEYVIIDETLIDATALFCLQRRYNVMQKCSCSAAQCIKRPTELGAGYTMRYKYSTTDPSLELLVEKMSVIDLDIDADDLGFLKSGAWHGFER